MSDKKVKCGYADDYQATKAPECGCEVCELKWELKKAQKGYFEVEWEFSPDDDITYSDDYYYDLFDGGYIKPMGILKTQEQIDIIENAVAIVDSFLVEAEAAG